MRRVKSIRLTRRALEEAKSARAWYLERDGDLPNRFGAALDSTISRIAATPGIGSSWPGVPELKRTVVDGFPYWVIYEDGAEITVVAVAHHRRRPLYWLVR